MIPLPRIGRPRPESVFFYTFHKCASSLFGDYLLGRISGLRHRDYAALIYTGRLRGPIAFAERGFVYGPLRLSATPGSDELERVVAPTATQDFVREKRCLFLVRDPRDILVSSYYSFGFSHPLSPVAEIREQQLREREEIRSLTLDEYVLSQADEQRRHFALLHELRTACRRGILLRYEDLVEDFDRFSEGLRTHLDVEPRVLRELERRSRPRPAVDASQHRRSGRPGQFRDALDGETIRSLDERLGATLSLFDYEG